VQELVALSEPYIKNEELANWVSQKVAATLSLDFRSWKQKIYEVRSAYDDEAFKSLVVAMKNNGIINIIEERRLICTAVIPTAPIIHASGINRGVFMWRVKMPVMINYESSKGIDYVQKLSADVLVQRVSTLKNAVGIDIKQIVLAQDS
jgi:intracellular multiplication protein IcmL